MSLQLTLTGTKEATTNLRKIAGVVGDDSRMKEFAKKALEPVAEAARDLAPVLSGELRDGIVISDTLPDGTAADFNGRAVFVGPLVGDAFYAGFLEFGTVKMRAQPFLMPAWDAEEKHVIDILGELAGKAMLTAV